MDYGKTRRFGALLSCLAALLLPSAAHAQAVRVRISALSDVGFGTITNFTTDLSNSQNVCAHSTASGARYTITATGSGAGGAFSLQAGSAQLAYEVQWADRSGQSTGTALTAGVARGGFSGNGGNSNCRGGSRPTASLITTLRASAISTARAGAYLGTLTLLIAPN